MTNLYAVVEDGRLAEDHVLRPYLIFRHRRLAVVEPYQVHDAGTVGEVGDDAHLPWPHLKLLEAQDAPHHLHKRHVASQLTDGVHLRAVHVFVRIVFQQVTERLDAQFLPEHLLAPGTHARQVLYVLL